MTFNIVHTTTQLASLWPKVCLVPCAVVYITDMSSHNCIACHCSRFDFFFVPPKMILNGSVFAYRLQAGIEVIFDKLAKCSFLSYTLHRALKHALPDVFVARHRALPVA